MIKPPLAGYTLSVLGVAAMTLLIALVPGADHLANVSLLYLLVVMGAAFWCGRGAAVLASVLAVLAFDWFFISPRQTFNVNNPAEWLALFVFLVTGVLIGQLTNSMRARAQIEAHAEALAEADKLKTALLSMVSHDFRSPLTSIKTGVSTLLHKGAPLNESTQRELLIGIEEETDRLNRMVGNILALSRLEAGAWQPQREAIPISELVGAALDTLNDEENARIEVHLENPLLEVSLDSVQIVQVLHNLLKNALKYSTRQSRVELRAFSRDENLVMEVLDRGAGLSSEETDKIFERFYRAARWRESATPGAGIGLAICRGLVEAHGGTLTARNRDGGGAAFRVSLPLHQIEDERSYH